MTYEQKLFFLLLLLVILPCILLAGFAVQALLGQKVLIEQQVKESYKALAHSTHRRIYDRIKAKEKIVDDSLQQSPWRGQDPSISTICEPINKDPFFKFLYIVDQEYNIVYPRERSYSSVADTFMPIENYNLFKTAYRYEFQEKNYNAAIDEYQKIVAEGHEKNLDTVGYALMAIARCHAKTKKIDKALETYQYLTTLYNNHNDLQSLIFLIYAKGQIAKIYEKQKDNLAYYRTSLDLLRFIIDNEELMAKAQYRYHYRRINKELKSLDKDRSISSKERDILLEQRKIILQKQEQIKIDEEALQIANRHILPLLKVMTREGERLSGYLDYRIGSRQNLAYYRTIVDNDNDVQGYVVYVIDLERCIQKIVIPILQSQAGGKDIMLAVIDQNNQAVVGEVPVQFYLIASQPMSPFFSFWSIAVYLENFQTLDELSRYRSRLYFFGVLIVILILLIGVYITIATFIREVKSARLKSDFVSNVTHELKTPLTAIKMFVETLLERNMEKNERIECLQVISSETERLQRLIDRILDFAKMEQHRRTFHFSLENIGELIRETVDHFKKQEKEMAIKIDIEPNLPRALVDAEAICEALMNLLSNACKYNDKPEKEIRLSCTRRDENSLAISVADNGIGFSKHEYQRIFQNFYRIENPQTTHIEGTGLGLALVDSIVKAHKGKTKVHSRINIGSKFTIILNCHPQESMLWESSPGD